MVYYAVIDTNVFIAALLSKRADAATVRVLEAMFDGKIVPLYHEDILAEYDEVLHRSKFHFKEETIQLVINAVKQYGVEVFPQPTGEILIDMDDLIFYEVAMEKREDDAYLVTGNQKHYPIRDFIVTPAERNIEIFNSFVKEFLHKDSTYKQQIENFQVYLKKYKLEDRVFNLYETNAWMDCPGLRKRSIRYFLRLKSRGA